MSSHLVIDTVTVPEALDRFHRALDEIWAEHRCVPSAIRVSVATAVAEIGANIIEHAAPGRSVPLRMEIDVSPHQITVVFTDGGDPAGVNLEDIRLPQESAHRGRGLAVASAVLGGLAYQRDGSTNRWTLISRRFG